MIDARRMEVYAALYDKDNNEILPPRAEIIDAASFSEYFKEYTLVFAGDGAAKCRENFAEEPGAVFSVVELPSSVHMIPLAETAFNEGRFEDVATFEPYYLKDFIAGKPHVKGLK
jgi:tRNA threonylcarbamoyladenosine biosynthesis protein TsaB